MAYKCKERQEAEALEKRVEDQEREAKRDAEALALERQLAAKALER